MILEILDLIKERKKERKLKKKYKAFQVGVYYNMLIKNSEVSGEVKDALVKEAKEFMSFEEFKTYYQDNKDGGFPY